MSVTIAQAISNPSGASRAADFQPETQNPQSSQNQLFSQPDALQTGSQADLLEKSQARISVPDVADADGQPASQASSSWFDPWIAMFVIAMALGIFTGLLRRRTLRARPAATQAVPDPAVAPVLIKSSKPKPAPKKSKSKRKQRARR